MIQIYSDIQPFPQYNRSFPTTITHLAFLQDGSYLLAGDTDGTIYTLYTPTNRLLGYIPPEEPILEFLTPENQDSFFIVTQTTLARLSLTSKLAGFYSIQAVVFVVISVIALVTLTIWILLPRREKND
jgi:hypothetical protein